MPKFEKRLRFMDIEGERDKIDKLLQSLEIPKRKVILNITNISNLESQMKDLSK
jgi:hypothetical protein